MKAGEQHAAAKHYTSPDAFMVPPNDDEVNAALAQVAQAVLHAATLSSRATTCLYPPGMSTLAQSNATWSANVEVCFKPNCRAA
jgi:hypothetical protein